MDTIERIAHRIGDELAPEDLFAWMRVADLLEQAGLVDPDEVCLDG